MNLYKAVVRCCPILGWGNSEQQLYTDSSENVYVTNGCLYIVPKFSTSNNEYYSARLRSKGGQTFQFGRIDVGFSAPAMDGVWPAIWMMPEDDVYGNWPWPVTVNIIFRHHPYRWPHAIHSRC